jgi:hypothetical protein
LIARRALPLRSRPEERADHLIAFRGGGSREMLRPREARPQPARERR